VDRAYYDATDLDRVVTAFERRYHLPSAVFYERHASGARLEGIPGFHRHVWASFYRDVLRLRGHDFAATAGRVLELA
jgi:hypothetical protein